MGQGNTLDSEGPKLNLQVSGETVQKGKDSQIQCVCTHVSLDRHTCVHACTCAWTRICVKAETQRNKEN